MITIDSLAEALDVTRKTIETLAGLLQDPDLFDADTETLTEDGAAIIRAEVESESDKSLLADVEVARDELEQKRRESDDALEVFNAAIRAAVRHGHPRYVVADHAGLSGRRVGQIYDGVR